jgi:hypothetical protein
MPDPGLVPDGAKCEDEKVKKKIEIPIFIPRFILSYQI